MKEELKQALLILSKSPTWPQAKKEWTFQTLYIFEDYKKCLCGHYPIKNICVIHNQHTEHNAEIGNCCVKNFLGINKADKILSSITRIKKKQTASINKEALQYLISKNMLTDWEQNFYSDIHRKRKLSQRQKNIKAAINKKLIELTIYQTSQDIKKIDSVLTWSKDNHYFDTTFIESLKKHATKYGRLSTKQSQSLNNIIEKFNIPC